MSTNPGVARWIETPVGISYESFFVLKWIYRSFCFLSSELIKKINVATLKFEDFESKKEKITPFLSHLEPQAVAEPAQRVLGGGIGREARGAHEAA